MKKGGFNPNDISRFTPDDVQIGFNTKPKQNLLQKLKPMINEAYSVGETGIVADAPKHAIGSGTRFERVNAGSLKSMLKSGSLMVAM